MGLWSAGLPGIEMPVSTYEVPPGNGHERVATRRAFVGALLAARWFDAERMRGGNGARCRIVASRRSGGRGMRRPYEPTVSGHELAVAQPRVAGSSVGVAT